MDRDEILNGLPEAGLARLREDIERLLQPSIRIHDQLADEDRLAIGCSKIGGMPDLPQGFPWPKFNDSPLSFIAQIDLAEAVSYDPLHRLPEDGRLLFFYDAHQETYGDHPGEENGWRVLHIQDSSVPAQHTAFPAALSAEARFKPCRADFSQELTLPQRPSLFLPGMRWTDEEKKRYEDFQYSLSHAAASSPEHRMLGYADEIQDDMHLQAALYAHGVPGIDDPRAAALEKTALDWVLLLQVDSDDQAGMRWASAGRLYYWIERQALKKRRFENVWLILQSD